MSTSIDGTAGPPSGSASRQSSPAPPVAAGAIAVFALSLIAITVLALTGHESAACLVASLGGTSAVVGTVSITVNIGKR